LLLLFSVFTEIPIAMVFLSLVLPLKTNRWLTTVPVILITLFVIGGDGATYSYYFFATLEIASMLAILWYVWKVLGETA
jgi:Sec-independent protein secretion pathway component TatC